MKAIDGFILAGGANSRMGRDKAVLSVGEKSSLERAAAILRSVTRNLYVIGESRENSLGLRFLPDVYQTEKQTRGSIIGLQAALTYSKSGWTAVLACDLPFASGELFKRLVSLGESGDFGAVAPVQPDGKLQPLCALYRSRACLPEIEKMLAEGDWRLQGIFGRVKTRRVEFSEIADLPNAADFFFNINTPADFAAALEIENSRGEPAN